MRVEIRHTADCPNWEQAGRMVRQALIATGHPDVEIGSREIRTPQDAENFPYAGSPTLVLDGVDIFPGAERIVDLACRLYATPNGLAGLPTLDQLTNAIAARRRVDRG
ncbi:thioredoxin family protein [Cryobacterium tagatosivorans]|uniref:Thioredoxin family protein n=1 Tax=Cryobacterium tagatosivorans TaxID=1259199 RepID=A0A4R8UGF8_9MICO|nr:thioredoxin family protein [Cryobacterium tagatosivorans]TFB54413.1 thioredoxin family protein [Cryobacterium tagatosivorans]